MSDPILVFGQGGGNAIYEAAQGFLDDGNAYQFLAVSDRAAPAGVRGECLFPVLYLAISHTMAAEITVTPIVDDTELEAVTLTLTAKTTRILERFKLGLSVPVRDGLGAERARCAPRGAWCQVRVADTGLASGDLIFEQVVVEYEVVVPSLTGVGV